METPKHRNPETSKIFTCDAIFMKESFLVKKIMKSELEIQKYDGITVTLWDEYDSNK